MTETSLALARMLEVAEADLQAATGGAPLCKASQTGTTNQSVKYFEGRWAALREVHRGADPRESFHRWRREHEAHIAKGAGQDWVHYSAGGVDALFELLAATSP